MTGSSRIAFDSMDIPERWFDRRHARRRPCRTRAPCHQSFDDSAE
jgi:hypothetical protein